jgi:hypothetical protein
MFLIEQLIIILPQLMYKYQRHNRYYVKNLLNVKQLWVPFKWSSTIIFLVSLMKKTGPQDIQSYSEKREREREKKSEGGGIERERERERWKRRYDLLEKQITEVKEG